MDCIIFITTKILVSNYATMGPAVIISKQYAAVS